MLDEPELRDAAGARAVAEEVVAARRALAAATPTRWFCGAWEGRDGCNATLYSDGRTAQVENVGTRARTCAAAAWPAPTVSLAVDAALADGHELVLIFADDDDWPKDLYAKLGFRTVGRVRTLPAVGDPATGRAPPRAEPPMAVLGLDLGTSAVKALLAPGRRRATRSSPPPPARWTPRARAGPRPTRAAWLAAAGTATAGGARAGRRASPSRRSGWPGRCTASSSRAPTGTPVRPALLWPDRRAGAELGAWRALAPEVRARLGNPLVPGMAGPLLGWLAATSRRRSAPPGGRSPRRTGCGLALTGTAATEASDASATLLWDLAADGWSAGALAVRRASTLRCCPRSLPQRRRRPGR